MIFVKPFKVLEGEAGFSVGIDEDPDGHFSDE